MLRIIRQSLIAAALAVAVFVGVTPAHAQTAAQIVSYTNGQLPDFGAVSISVANVRDPINSLTTALSTSGTGTFTYGGGVSTSRPISTSSYVRAATYYGDGSNLTGLSTTPSWYSILNIPSAIQAISNTGAYANNSQPYLFIGKGTGNNTLSGNSNVGYGINALTNLTIGSSNTAVGVGTLNATNSGNYNTGFGANALAVASGSNSTDNVGLGFLSMGNATQAYRSVGVGSLAMALSPNVSNSTCVGYQTCATAGGSGQNKMWNTTAVGSQAGGNLADASGNTLLGYQAGVALTTGNGNIVIGNGVTPSTVPTSSTNNYLNLGNAVFGDIANAQPTGGNAAIGINTTSPAGALDVSGLLVVRNGISATGAISGTTASFTSASIGSIAASTVTATNLYGGLISASYQVSGTTTPVNIAQKDEISVLSFGAKCDGVTNDAAAFQAAFNYSTSATITQPKATCKINSPLTINVINRPFDGKGGVWDMSALTSGTAITFVSSTGYQSQNGAINNNFGNVFIIGPGRTSAVDGISFTTHNFTTRNVQMDGFRYCHSYGSNSYIITNYSNWLNHCLIAINMPGGYTNYGENIRYYGGGLGNGTSGVYMNNANADMYIDGMSMDYNINTSGTLPQFVQLDSGQLNITNAHMETDGSTIVTPTFIVSNSSAAILSVNGGILVNLGGSSFTGTSSSVYVADNAQARFTGVKLQNTAFVGGCLKSGNGRMYVTGSKMNDVPQVGNCVAPYNSSENMFGDGGFEKPGFPLVDNIFISGDTTSPTSPVSGTNVSLTIVSSTAHTGTNSLQINKVGASGTRAQVRMMVPLRRNGDMVVGSFYYSKPCTQTGNVFLSAQWVTSHGTDQYGIPIVTSASTIGTVTVNSTSSTIPWTVFSGSAAAGRRPPLSATHYSILINADSMNAGCFNIDTNNANEM